ncbi:MAG: hypothetical protein U0271_17290 [Polyangiaceae bacterium]
MRRSVFDVVAAVLGTPPDAVYLAPNIDPKKLANALASYARLATEAPVMLFDNTVWGSAKSGALLTTHALYVDTHGSPIPLGELTSLPHFDESQGDGWTRLRDGSTAMLPRMLTGEAHACFRRTLEAIVAENHGASLPGVGAPLSGPIGQFAIQFLRVRRVWLAPQLPDEKLRAAWATFHDWPDWAAGERIVAYVDETAFGKGDEGLVLTDRRLVGLLGERPYDLSYGHIDGVAERKAVLAHELFVHAAGGARSIKLAFTTASEAVPPLAAFLHALTSLPRDQRFAHPRGAQAILAELPHPDPRVVILLQLAAAGVSSRWFTPAEGELIARSIEVLALNTQYGRGSRFGGILSPLGVDDAAHLLAQGLGPPMVQGQPGELVLDFFIDARSNVGRAALSTAVGLTALAIVGIGWVSTPTRVVRAIRALLRPTEAGSCIFLYGMRGALWESLLDADEALFDSIESRLGELEALTLLHRMLLGAREPPQALFTISPDEVSGRVGAILGPTDLSVFFVGPRR